MLRESISILGFWFLCWFWCCTGRPYPPSVFFFHIPVSGVHSPSACEGVRMPELGSVGGLWLEWEVIFLGVM